MDKQAPLNPKQRAFITEYLKDRNATRAYMRAYGASQESADRSGPRLLGHVGVRAEIDRLEAVRLEQVQVETGITLERTLRQIAKTAFFDPRKLYDADGNLLQVHQLDGDTASVIAGLDVEVLREDGKTVGAVRKYKLASRLDALDKLMRHLGGYAKDNAQKPPPAQPAEEMSMVEVARRLAYLFRAGQLAAKAANDSGARAPDPRQAAS